MSKEFSVAAAIVGQLHRDEPTLWPPTDLNKIMGANCHYDLNSISLFLAAVQSHLKNGSPSYDFEFDAAFANSALGWSVGTLIGQVNQKTT